MSREESSDPYRRARDEAFADLSPWRKLSVQGADAPAWLGDLVSADIADLAPGRARRSLLLSPTGRVRAEFTVAAREEGYLLLQDPLQPHRLDGVLEPYVLSSAVTLDDRTADLALISIPEQALAHVSGTNGLGTSSPSCLWAGVDLLAPADGHDALVSGLSRHLRTADSAELEAWRISAAIPRLGVDATLEDLPQEAGLESAVAFSKGCYLGQEAVARARNLGHPRRLLLALQAGEPVAAGEPLLIGGIEAGRVTSASPVEGSTLVLARVSWPARGGPFRTASGIELRPRRPL